MQNHMSDMFSVVAGLKATVSIGPGKAGSGAVASANGSRAKPHQNDFLGFLRAFAGATGKRRPGNGSELPGTGNRSRRSRLTRHQRALGRIADMATRGELRIRDLQELPEDEWEKLEAWVLDGAGGAYAPAGETEDGLSQPEADLPATSGNSDLADDELETITVNGLDSREALLALLSGMQAEAAAAITTGGSSETMTGMEPVNDSLRNMPVGKELALALISELLPKSGVFLSSIDDGQLLPEQIRGMFSELQDKIATMTADELSTALRKAITATVNLPDDIGARNTEVPQAPEGDFSLSLLAADESDLAATAEPALGVDLQATLDRLAELPLAMLRSLAAKVLDAGVRENPGTGNSLLAALAANKELKGRLLGMMHSGSDTSSQDEVAEEQNPVKILDDGESDKEQSDGKGVRRSRGRGHSLAGMTLTKSQIENSIQAESDSGHELVVNANVVKVVATTLSESEPLPGQVSIAGAEPFGTHASSTTVQPGILTGTSVNRADALPSQDLTSHFIENLQRVEQVMRMSVRRGISHVSLQLSPAELGQVTLRLKMSAGVVSATVEAENPDAGHMLANGLQQLRENLQVHGIELESFDVFLTGGQAGEGKNERWPKLARRWRQHAKEDNEPVVGLPAAEAVEVGRMGFGKDGSFDFVV